MNDAIGKAVWGKLSKRQFKQADDVFIGVGMTQR